MKQTVKKLKIGANFHHDLIFVVHDFHSHAVIHRAGKLTAMMLVMLSRIMMSPPFKSRVMDFHSVKSAMKCQQLFIGS